MRIHPKLSERDCLPMPYAVRSDWQETSGEDLVKLVHRQFMDNAEQAEDWRAKRCGELIRGGGFAERVLSATYKSSCFLIS
jgi:hypothetical protein